jgi:hypothetical protein
MLAGEALARALAELSIHSFKGTAYRIIPAQYHVSALSGIGSLTMGPLFAVG